MSDSEYLVLIGKGSLRSLSHKLKGLGGFYTPLGWVFSTESKSALDSIVENLSNYSIHRFPLGPNKTLEGFKKDFTAKYLKKLLAEQQEVISQEMDRVSLHEMSYEVIQELKIGQDSKDHLLNLLQKKEDLEDAIEHAEGLARVLHGGKNPKIDLKFISEQDINYLLEEAPEMPRLVNFIEDGKAKPFIRRGVVGALVGAGGIGKTHALAQLAIAIATATNWLGIYPIEEKGHVCMILGENADDDTWRLLRKIIKGLSKHQKEGAEIIATQAVENLAVMSVSGSNVTLMRDGTSTPFYNAFLQELKDKEPEEGWACIILDPLSRFMGDKTETDNAAATQLITLLERICLELRGKPTVIFGHHMNKSGISGTVTDQGAARGSSALTDGMRWQANLERVRKKQEEKDAPVEFELNQIILRSVKSNFTAMLPPQLLEKDERGCLAAHIQSIVR